MSLKAPRGRRAPVLLRLLAPFGGSAWTVRFSALLLAAQAAGLGWLALQALGTGVVGSLPPLRVLALAALAALALLAALLCLPRARPTAWVLTMLVQGLLLAFALWQRGQGRSWMADVLLFVGVAMVLRFNTPFVRNAFALGPR